MSKKILITDDEAYILRVVAMKLEKAGYEVITAMDGQEALDLFVAEQPDMLITDYQMPVMTGAELCRQVRRCRTGSDVPILMLTARGFDMEPHDASHAGINALLTKPFSPRELLAKVNELLESSSDAVRSE